LIRPYGHTEGKLVTLDSRPHQIIYLENLVSSDSKIIPKQATTSDDRPLVLIHPETPISPDFQINSPSTPCNHEDESKPLQLILPLGVGVPWREEEDIFSHDQPLAQEAPLVEVKIVSNIQGDHDLFQTKAAGTDITEDLFSPFQLRKPIISIADVGKVKSAPLPYPENHSCPEDE